MSTSAATTTAAASTISCHSYRAITSGTAISPNGSSII
jgi:hypothetical protein